MWHGWGCGTNRAANQHLLTLLLPASVPAPTIMPAEVLCGAATVLMYCMKESLGTGGGG